MNITRKIKIASENTTTYRAGLLQTKAFRILNQRTTEILSEFGITTIEWAFLGLLYEAPLGTSSGALADELGVEASFVTQIVQRLKSSGHFAAEIDPEDNRVKIFTLTKSGRSFVQRTEKHVRKNMKPLLKNIPLGDLITYLSVMQSVIDNDSEHIKD
jgi:DNA-binding MarR family transcriptional regulator